MLKALGFQKLIRSEATNYGIPARPSKAKGPESFRGVNGLSSDVGVSDRSCDGRPDGTLSGCVGCHPGMLIVALRARSSVLELGAGEAELRVSSVCWSSCRWRFSTLSAKFSSSARSPS